jgi:transcriptional regulator with XRE-family HTH domain
MNILSQNYLSNHRKDYNLQLSDVSHLLNMDSGNLSRQETGQSLPSLTTVLGYHILFKGSLHQLFKEDYMKLYDDIINRALLLHDQLQAQKTPKAKHRLKGVRMILNRLVPDELLYEGDEDA